MAAKTLPTPKVEVVELSKLKPWDKNPRKNHAVTVIEESIKQFGYLNLIVVQKDTYRVLAGHGRLLAMKKAGVEKVPVMIADLDDKAANLFTVTDNKTTLLSEWDFQGLAAILKDAAAETDLGALGWSDHELEPILSAEWKPEPEGDLGDFQRGKEGAPIRCSKTERALIDKAIGMAKVQFRTPDVTEGAALSLICRAWMKTAKPVEKTKAASEKP